MKTKFGVYLSAIILVGLGAVMAITNPTPDSYTQYAARRLTQELKEKECVKIDDGLRDLCKLLDGNEGQSLVKRLVTNNTERQNYFLFSIYKTDLSTRKLLPSFLTNLISVPSVSYTTETIGLLDNFQTYKAERQQSN
jgi:hypothetical protein